MAKRNRQRGTLASLAAELGVSRTTVSNAYNRPEQLSASLREKILATAEQRGYPGPHPTARSLRTRRAGAIGVLLTEHLTYAFDDLASVDFLAGMAEASYGGNTCLTLVPVGPDSSVDVAAAAQLVNQPVIDGFVVYSVAADDPYLQAARNRRLPLVICDQPADETGLPFVGIDDRAAIAPAAQALIDAGHRRIGILSIRLDRRKNDGPVSPERLRNAGLHVQRSRVLGALDVFASAGIDPATVSVIERHINDRANNIDAARELLETHPDLTAVLCTTDSMALGVLDYCADHGISVPDRLSVTGFDGIVTAVARDLTTVIQPNREKGAAAGRMLFRLIEQRLSDEEPPAGESLRELLETTFRPGGTVAAPRSTD
ncbi:LacI family DNA-binding transcriptional regulator [Corynebacterium antarcticum]|uniref:LacI family DNA-binding transcriptional regulator n=1 Tax=Corynebacterium antarcticum TaxID=2800405 RepID=A0A9Q4GNJ9_9CORY|nr:LacI family DNA-binding transcriptional regulator [Corynebacterium antarcticum]MCK7661890.1 LacI family DNA-binding transcriptional regulator [Corynebacterium antarcticum]MCX7538916.1 LacI family DNA-binding transcriptional regulator [Corynebacterium antarcticum]